jgi:sigma-B regulation protein RsbU (phosphoserine phosphatase)
MVLYSVGVTEAQSVDGSEFGEARLVEVMKQYQGASAGDMLEHVIDAVMAFAHGAEQYDDVTALVIRYTGPGSAAGA